MAAGSICTRCNQHGHVPAQCPHKKHTCEKCGGPGHTAAACYTLTQYVAQKPPPAAAGYAAPVVASQAPKPLTADGWRCKNPACEEFNSDGKVKACFRCKKPRDKEDIQKTTDAIPLCKQKGTEVVERLHAATDAAAS